MSDIFITGNVKIITREMLEKIKCTGKIVLWGETLLQTKEEKRIVVFPYREEDEEYRGIFRSYHFETTVYFSNSLDGKKRLLDELEKLENTLYSAALNGVKQFVYLTTNDYVGQKNETTRTKLLFTCEEICRQFAEEKGMNVLILRLPYLYSVEESECRLAEILKTAESQNEIVLDGSRQRIVDFLCQEDLGELLSRICDETAEGFRIAGIPGGNAMELERLGQILTEKTGIRTVKYSGYQEAVPKSMPDTTMKEWYGWFPQHSLEEDMQEVIAMLEENKIRRKKKRRKHIRHEKVKTFFQVGIEIVVLFLLAEFLISWTKDNYRIDYVDFRLLFVVTMGIIHGTGAGIVSSVLAAAGYFARDAMQSNWQIIFFNIENWMPFAAYFLSGTITGHVRDKNNDIIKFLKAQQKILENKYHFLSNLYTKTLENKEEFGRQIIGYEDSFGRLYQVVRKLNSTMTDDIFYEAIYSIEEILDTTSAAIYTIGENIHFARLNVCSREMNERLSKSLNLEKYPVLAESLRQNRNWYNAEGFGDYPAYAAPIWKNGKLCGAVVLWNVRANQMKMDFYNKFCILSGLIQDALLRAIEYRKQKAAEQMIGGTKILKPKYFEEILARKEKMGKEGLSDYALLEMVLPEKSLHQFGELAAEGIRSTDVVGMRADGKPYLLLNQATGKSLETVGKRLEEKGIKLINREVQE